MLMKGMSFSVTAPIRLIPPIRMTATNTASTIPMDHFKVCSAAGETAVKLVTALITESVMLLTCDILPMPNEARAANPANRQASHFQFLPKPLEM